MFKRNWVLIEEVERTWPASWIDREPRKCYFNKLECSITGMRKIQGFGHKYHMHPEWDKCKQWKAQAHSSPKPDADTQRLRKWQASGGGTEL